MSGIQRSYVSLPSYQVDELRRKARIADSAAKRARREEKARQALERQRRAQERQLRDQRERESRLSAQLTAMGAEHAEFEHQVRQKIKAQEEDFRQTLKRSNEAFNSRIQDFGQDLEQLQQSLALQRTEFLALFRDQEEALHRALSVQEAALRTEIQNVAAQVFTRLANERDICAHWRKKLENELDIIKALYRHNQFTPGELDKLVGRLDLGVQNADTGVFQTAIGAFQEAYINATLLEERLVLLEAEWDHYRDLAEESLFLALDAITEHEKLEIVVGQEEIHEVDVDDWASRELSTLRAELETALQSVRNRETPCSLDDLRNALKASEEAYLRIANAVSKARNGVLASNQRHVIQEAFLNHLSERGYRLEGYVWEADDRRRANHLHLSLPTGEEMVIMVTPAEKRGAFSNEIQVSFKDHSPDDLVRQERLREVNKVLQQSLGMDAEPFSCTPGYEGDNAPKDHFDLKKVSSAATEAQHGV